jgi:hypothetical protein
MKNNPKTPVIFIILDDKYKEESLFAMKKLAEKIEMTAIIITDIKDK